MHCRSRNSVSYQVTKIKKNAFKNNKKIKKIVIPSSVVSIENYAFANCKNLKTIEIRTTKLKNKKISPRACLKNILRDRRKASPSRLSGGQKQRLATADALAGLPACLVLDEPTAMLDPDSRKEVINIVKELNRKEGMTIILITHHTDEVVDADRIVLMQDGKIIGDDIPKKIFADYELLKKAKMDIPPVVELGMRLEKQQIGLEGPVLQEQEMIEKIVKLYRSKCGGKKDAAR